MSKQKQKVRLPVWIKLALFSGTLAAIATSVMGLSLSSIYESSLSRSSLDYGTVVAADAAQTIELELEEIEVGLLNVQRILTTQSTNADEQIQRALLLVESNKALDHVNIYDGSGKWIDTIKEQKATVNKAAKTLKLDQFKSAPKTPIKLGEWTKLANGKLRIEVLMPLKTKEGKQTGYLHTLLPMTPIQARIDDLVRKRMDGDVNRVFVVDGQQRIMAHANDKMLTQKIKTLPHVKGMTDEMIKAGVSQSGPYTDDKGNKMLAVYHPIPEARWGIITQIPYKVAYEPLEKMQRYVAIVLILAVLVSIILAFLLARRLTAPIGSLMKMADALGRRQFDQRVEVNSGDEFSILGEALSHAAADLEESEQTIRQEQRIRQDLGRFLPQELVDQVITQDEQLTLGGKRVQVTALFADVVSFTPICEQLEPEMTVAILNELFTIVTEIIFRHQGTVDKFMGDCVMAFWGPPNAADDHATRALEAAEEIIGWLDVGNANWREKYGIEIQLAVGINTGDAIVGNIGSETRMEYTAIGDAINVAARLESIARPNQILTSQSTIEAAEDMFDVQPIGEKRLVGRDEPMLIYEVHP